MKKLIFLIAIAAMFLMSSCSVSQMVSGNQQLVSGANVRYTGQAKSKHISWMSAELKSDGYKVTLSHGQTKNSEVTYKVFYADKPESYTFYTMSPDGYNEKVSIYSGGGRVDVALRTATIKVAGR